MPLASFYLSEFSIKAKDKIILFLVERLNPHLEHAQPKFEVISVF